MDKDMVLKVLEILDSKNCLRGDDKVWFERLINNETLTLYIGVGDLYVGRLNDEHFEYTFNVTITDIFTVLLNSIGVSWEYC